MGLFKNSIKKYKIIIGFVLIILLFIFCGAVTIRGLVTLGNFTRTLYHHPLVVTNASLLAALEISEMHSSMKDFAFAASFQDRDAILKIVSEKETRVYQQLDVIQKNILGRQGRTLARQTRQIFKDWKPIRQELERLTVAGSKKNVIRLIREKEAGHVGTLNAKILQLSAYAGNKADAFMKSGEATQSKLERIAVLLTLAGIFLSLVIAVITTFFVLNAEKTIQTEKDKLQSALDEIKTLHGIIPICSHCKQIRDDKGLWKRMEEYIHEHSTAKFSHGICPDCIKKHYSDHR